MVLLSLLFVIKTFIFINFTKVIQSPFLVALVTISISISIMYFLDSFFVKRRKLYLGIFYSLISLIMFVDVVYLSYFNTLPSIKMLVMTRMLGNVTGSVLSLINTKTLLPVLDLPFVYFYLYYNKKELLNKHAGLIVSGIFASVACFLFIISIGQSKFNILKFQELYSYHISDIYINTFKDNTVSSVSNPYKEADIDKIKERSKFRKGKFTGIAKDKNLIVIQVEALQNFVINLEYNGQVVTPNLNMLIEDSGSIYYNNYFQLLGRGNTSDAEFVSNNSLHPSLESPTYSQYENNTWYGLPWLLRDNGYNAWAFHGYEKDFWNRNKAYKNLGFQRFVSAEDFELGDIIELGLSDEDFFDQSMAYLNELDQIDDKPFYAFMVTLSSHNPFTLPDKYKELKLLPEHENTLLGDYLQSIHYADKALWKFIKELKKEAYFDNSLIAIYGDHFAIPNSSKEVTNMMDKFLEKKYDFDSIMNIPLILHLPNSDIGFTESKIGSQLDFMPTITNMLGIENKKGLMFGVDLNNYEGYNNVKPQTIMRKGSFIDDKVLFQMASTEIFDNSLVKDRKTGKNLDLASYREIYDNVIFEINLSDYILRNNLIKNLLESGKIFTEDTNKVTDTSKLDIIKSQKNSIDEITSISEKYNFIAVSIDFNNKKDRLILKDKDKTLLEYLLYWLNGNKDSTIVFKCDSEDNEIYNLLRYEIPTSKSDHIVEINSFDKYYFAQSYGFEKILINLKNNNYDEKSLLDFINAHKVYGIVVDELTFDSNLAKQIIEKGVLIYRESDTIYQILR